ncbi:MAG: alpha/beta hydrolase [Pseudomonadota bacterium]
MLITLIRGIGFVVLALVLGTMVIGWIAALMRIGSKPPYEMVDIGDGRRLHVVCEGPVGAPFVLYDAGAFGIYTDGWWVKEELKSDYRVCLYDRAGMGWSDPMPTGASPTPDWHIEDMRRLRAALGENQPFVLVGHSMAGLRLHGYANLYKEELQGLVFVDAARPGSLRAERIRQIAPWAKRIMNLSIGMARAGLMGGLSYLLPDELDLPKQQGRDKRRSLSIARHHKSTKAELVAAFTSSDDVRWAQGQEAETLPVAVFTNSDGGGSNGSVARAAEVNTGFGRITVLPEETHVSLLNRTNAKLIASDVRAMMPVGEPSDG